MPLAGINVVDLFAGSGALGIEALSRGAASAIFVERNPGALAAIRTNLQVLGEEAHRGLVVRADARSWTPPRPRGADAARLDGVASPVDVVFADPPYAFDGWQPLLARWAARSRLAVLETSGQCVVGSEWEILRQKRYGGTVVTVARSVQNLRRPTRSLGPA